MRVIRKICLDLLIGHPYIACANHSQYRAQREMYVCICNALRDTQIAKAAQNGCGTVDQVYAALGCRTQCGQCREDAEAVIAGVPQADAGYAMMQAAE